MSSREDPPQLPYNRAENAAYVEALGARAIGLALARDKTTLKLAQKVSRKKSDQRRYAEARRQARPYVRRGREAHAALTELFMRMAEEISAVRVARPYEHRPLWVYGLQPLLSASAYVFTVPAAGENTPLAGNQAKRRPKRGNTHHRERRLDDAASMVVRRGTGQCINLSCKTVAGDGDYCPRCATDQDVQRDHNRRLKSIGTLWDSAAPYILDHVRQPPPPSGPPPEPWPLEKREAWLAARRLT